MYTKTFSCLFKGRNLKFRGNSGLGAVDLYTAVASHVLGDRQALAGGVCSLCWTGHQGEMGRAFPGYSLLAQYAPVS